MREKSKSYIVKGRKELKLITWELQSFKISKKLNDNLIDTVGDFYYYVMLKTK